MITSNINNNGPTAAPTGNDDPESPLTGRDGADGPTGVRIDVE